MDKRDYILSLFKLYSGKEKEIVDNPIDGDKDTFKWYMWRNEFMFYESYKTLSARFGGSADTEEGVKKGLEGYLKAFIGKWVGYPYSDEEEDKWYRIYQGYEKV